MIDKNLKKEDCCGCGACAQICSHQAIRMLTDNEGFSYPELSEDACVHCDICSQACPIERYDHHQGGHDPIVFYGAKHKDSDILMNSSSGGVFTALAQWILSENGVVCGCRYTESMTVEHTIVRELSQLQQLRGSKYVQSSLNETFREVKAELAAGHRVLFTGLPCQVEALRGYLRRPNALLITCDLLCYGTSSPLLFHKHLDFIEQKLQKRVKDINIRDKHLGWGKLLPAIMFTDGSIVRGGRYGWLWQNIYSSHLAQRPSCFSCRFTNFHRPGDLTIGDFWGIKEHHPDFFDERGVSLILVNTETGAKAFEAIKHKMDVIATEKSLCLQPSLMHPAEKPPNREQFWHDVSTIPFNKICVKYLGWGLKQRLVEKIKRSLHIQ